MLGSSRPEPSSPPRLLEICVDDPAGIADAVAGGADRLEVCAALALGGLTPSAGLVEFAVASGAPVHAMVRPRAGDFVLSAAEVSVMLAEIGRLADMGVAGVVVGATLSDGMPDRRALVRLRRAAAGCRLTFHRAVDLAPDPEAAVAMLVEAGVDHVLSSGGAANAIDGAPRLARMVTAAAGRLTVIGGAGITPDNVAALLRATGLAEVHASAAVTAPWGDPRIERFGFAAGPRRMTGAAQVAALKQALLAAG